MKGYFAGWEARWIGRWWDWTGTQVREPTANLGHPMEQSRCADQVRWRRGF